MSWSSNHVAAGVSQIRCRRRSRNVRRGGELIRNFPFDGWYTQVGWNAKRNSIFSDVFDFFMVSSRVFFVGLCLFRSRNLNGWGPRLQAIAAHNDIWGQITSIACLFHVSININHYPGGFQKVKCYLHKSKALQRQYFPKWQDEVISLDLPSRFRGRAPTCLEVSSLPCRKWDREQTEACHSIFDRWKLKCYDITC